MSKPRPNFRKITEDWITLGKPANDSYIPMMSIPEYGKPEMLEYMFLDKEMNKFINMRPCFMAYDEAGTIAELALYMFSHVCTKVTMQGGHYVAGRGTIINMESNRVIVRLNRNSRTLYMYTSMRFDFYEDKKFRDVIYTLLSHCYDIISNTDNMDNIRILRREYRTLNTDLRKHVLYNMEYYVNLAKNMKYAWNNG